MLVLSRRPSEKIVFPSLGIAVQVLSIRGNAIKLGIEAPLDIPVLRGELEKAPGVAPVPRPSEPSPAEKLLQAKVLMQQWQDLRDQGLTTEAEETLTQLEQVLESQDRTASRQPCLFPRTGVVPDVLVERAAMRGVMKPEQ